MNKSLYQKLSISCFLQCVKFQSSTVEAISFSGWAWTVVKDMTKMGVTNSTDNFLSRHEDDREVQWIGASLIGMGLLICYVFDCGFEGYDILETFSDVNDVTD